MLDPAGIVVASAPYGQTSPAAVFDGANYLAAWRDAREGYQGTDLYGTRVTPSGSVLEPDGLVFSATGTHAGGVALARGPSNSAIVVYSRIGSEPPYGGAQRAFLRFFYEGSAPRRHRLHRHPAPRRRRHPRRLHRPSRLHRRHLRLLHRRRPPVRCVVPRVIGLRLRAAKARIRARRCSVGRIRRARSRRVGRVIAQSPRPGRELHAAAGSTSCSAADSQRRKLSRGRQEWQQGGSETRRDRPRCRRRSERRMSLVTRKNSDPPR